MASSVSPFQTILPTTCPNSSKLAFGGTSNVCVSMIHHHQNKKNKRGGSMVVEAVGELSTDSTTYLIAGAIGVALVGTAFPIFFFRKDVCPECDGAGFVRQGGATLRANAARKDQTQIVCARCNGLGKLNQIDK
ncbi:Chaperone DnaJ [Senna tora]|uniref:Chaperone DnaJ n=1 Tax=Senna tora TaxID=362788 RepID=A0A834TPU7_9FABA|nr:Chaperone DnaJ [Senna tora]